MNEVEERIKVLGEEIESMKSELESLEHKCVGLILGLELVDKFGESKENYLSQLKILRREITRVEGIRREALLRYVKRLRDEYRRDVEELERKVEFLDQVLEHFEST